MNLAFERKDHSNMETSKIILKQLGQGGYVAV